MFIEFIILVFGILIMPIFLVFLWGFGLYGLTIKRANDILEEHHEFMKELNSEISLNKDRNPS